MSTPVFFYVATVDEMLTIDRPDSLKHKPVVRSKNISPELVGDLDFALTGERSREPITIRDDDVGVFKLDDTLVQALADLDDGRENEIADEWGIYDPTLVGELRKLAKKAKWRGEEMFLCF